MDISILIATYKRPALLKQELESFYKMDVSNISWEILIADNAADDRVRSVVEKFNHVLPVRYFVVSRQGKNFALNALLPEAGGELFVFTDDDIIADKNWLIALWEGARKWPDYSVFGGKILPLWPKDMKFTLPSDQSFLKSAYCIADWGMSEGAYRPQQVWGANFAVRKVVFDSGFTFNSAVGPSGTTYVSGSETELLLRLNCAGYSPIYLPKAVVNHQIRAEQLSASWLHSRAFKMGRHMALFYPCNSCIMIVGIPRYLLKQLLSLYLKRLFFVATFKFHHLLDVDINIYKILGQICQYRSFIKP